MTTDDELTRRINDLVDEERRLHNDHVGEGLSDEDAGRLAAVGVQLDRLWDLLRQRRALRESGQDPELAAMRDGVDVESYLQ